MNLIKTSLTLIISVLLIAIITGQTSLDSFPPSGNAKLLIAHIVSENSNSSIAFPGEEIMLDFKFNKSVAPKVRIMNKPVDLCLLDTQGLQWRGTYKTSSSDPAGKVVFVIEINGTNFTETTDGSSVFFENSDNPNGIILISPDNNAFVQNPVIFQWASTSSAPDNLFISGNLVASTNSSNATIFIGPGNYSWFVNSSNGLNLISETRFFTVEEQNNPAPQANQTNQTGQTTGIFWGGLKIANSSQFLKFNFTCSPNQFGCFTPLASCRQEIFNSSDFWMGNFSNLSGEEKINCTFRGNVSVEVSSANSTFLQYTWDSNKPMNFSIIKVKRNCKGTQGSVILGGFDPVLSSGTTKTALVDIVANFNSVCIKDSDIIEISEISESCTANDETFLQCNGQSIKGYNCTIENGRYKITGLNHSGIIEQASPAEVARTISHSGGCTTDWVCDKWGPCIDDLQIRTCTKQRSSCSSSGEKPLEIRSCLNSDFQTNSNPEQIYETQKLNSPDEVTGSAAGILQSPVLWITIFMIFILGILAIILFPKR
jgi:hypothetical protein